MFFLCSIESMNRISADALTPHLEAALMMAPKDMLASLQHPDRLQCFDISLAEAGMANSGEEFQPQLAVCA
jgi:hypothetical protein